MVTPPREIDRERGRDRVYICVSQDLKIHTRVSRAKVN